MKLLPIALTLITVAAFTGCALNPLPSSEKVLVDALPSNTSIPSGWKAESLSGAVTDGWLATFNDPALSSIITEALSNNLDLRIAAERVRIAQQQIILASAQMKPQIGINLGDRITYDDGIDGTFNATAAYLGIGWELDVWGRLRAQQVASENIATATALDYAYARQSLAAMVAKVWYITCQARQLVDLTNQSVEIYSEQLSLSKVRQSSGKDSNLGVVDTQAKLNSARAEYENALATYEQAQRTLELLLGRYPAAEIQASSSLTLKPGSIDSGVPLSILQRRPDLLAAEQIVFARFRLEESARLALLPDLSFSLAGGRLGDGILSLLSLNPWLATADIGMFIPLYEGGALRANIQIANAEQMIALSNYAKATLNAFKEVEDGLANNTLLEKQLTYQNNALIDSTEAVRIATAQYTAGRQDLLWVTTLQQNQIAVKAMVINVRTSMLINRINLNLALGRSFDQTPAIVLNQ